MSRYFLPHIDRMAGYVPGEQPRDGGFIKLNTNENPYPPSPRVLDALSRALHDRLRLYPDPIGTAFREAAARRHGVTPDMVLAGNGSDDLLTIITRAFAGAGDPVLCPSPSYILYRTLVELQNAREVVVEYTAAWNFAPGAFQVPGAKLAFLANPNSPSGTALTPDEVGALAATLECPLIVDEAYANFAETDCIALVERHPNVIVTRSFSKGYSLAGVRLGYLIAQPEIVAGLIKVKDSYNCDALSLAAGLAAAGGPGISGADAREDPQHPPPPDRRRARTRLSRPREPGQFRLVYRRPPRRRYLCSTQGTEDPRPPDALRRSSRRPADHRRHRRRDRPVPRSG